MRTVAVRVCASRAGAIFGRRGAVRLVRAKYYLVLNGCGIVSAVPLRLILRPELGRETITEHLSTLIAVNKSRGDFLHEGYLPRHAEKVKQRQREGTHAHIPSPRSAPVLGRLSSATTGLRPGTAQHLGQAQRGACASPHA